MPGLPKRDDRLVHIFLSVILFRDLIPHTRRCPLGAKHHPKVNAGQDVNNPHRLFMVYEECRGIDGMQCDSHGRQFTKQLTEKERATALAQVVQLEPFPYNSEVLLDWCVNYLLTRQHLLDHEASPSHALSPHRSASAPASAMHAGLANTTLATSHDLRHRRWVSSLIPPITKGRATTTHRGLARVVPSARPSSALSLGAPVTPLARVYCYVRNGCHPEVVEVDANEREAMTYVNLRHPDILKAFGLKPRARNLPERIQVYDVFADKWYHPAAVSLWLRLRSNEVLILRASTITRTPGLEDYTSSTFKKPARSGIHALRGFLTLSRTPADHHVPFSPVPPLTVMLADVPENPSTDNSSSASTSRRSTQRSTVPSSSRPPVPDRDLGAKRQKRNDGSAGVLQDKIIELTSDEEDEPSSSGRDRPSGLTQHRHKRLINRHVVNTVELKPSLPRKPFTNEPVIIISDDDEPAAGTSSRTAGTSSRTAGTSSRTAGTSSRTAGTSSTSRSTRAVLADPGDVIVIDDDSAPPTLRVPNAPNAAASFTLAAGTSQALSCSSFTVIRRRRDKGKAKIQAHAHEVKDDSGADSEKTLC